MATFDEFYRSLPEDSGKRGEFFEKVFVPWFLRTDPEWSNKIEKIWLWDEYPDRWGKDCGIDLVYQDNTGRHWAVQSKCISPDHEISKAEINSFLSESNDSRIHGRLLIASTDGIGRNAQQVIDRQEKQVVCFLREHFRQSEIEFPSTPLDLATGRRKDKRKPRPHQEEAIRNVVEGLKTQDRGQLLMACGTGKTLTSLWIKEELNSKLTLVLLPSLSLLSQTLREWSATSGESFNWICVCSDKSVANQDRTVDEWVKHVSELGIPVTSETEEIKQFLRTNEEGVVFSTYQSSPLIAEAQHDTDIPSFDIAFADEAHRCAGKVSTAFGCILDDAKIRSSKRLFMTATPKLLSRQIKSKAMEADIEVASMDDEEVFGKVLHRLNFSEAIERDLLTDYRVVVIGVDDPEIQARIKNRSLGEIGSNNTLDFENLAHHISLAKIINEYDLQRVITFHGQVKGAKKFSEIHPKIADWLWDDQKAKKRVTTGYVSGEMTALERNRQIWKLRDTSVGEASILSNARCLSEGVDVPTLDCIAFIDPRNSQVDIIQAVGRVIRKSRSKSYGYIVLPVYIPDTDHIQEELLASRFRVVWEIILALRSQDDSLAEVLDRQRSELGKRGMLGAKQEESTKIIFDLPSRFQNRIEAYLQPILVRNTTEGWMESYGRLERYTMDNGHARPPEDQPEVGRWTSNQRKLYNSGQLSKERTHLLERLEKWTWDIMETVWTENYEELIRFYNEHGHACPENKYPKLGNWVRVQRKVYAQGKLSEERRILLEHLSGWTWNAREDEWNDAYRKLISFAEEKGHVRPRSSDPIVGAWVSNQRLRFKQNQLRHDRILLLERLPSWTWEWDGLEERWQEKYSLLLEFIAETGHSQPKQTHKSLGTWIDTQRQFFKKSLLSEDRIALLERLPEWSWEPKEDDWEKKYQELTEFVHANGHARPPNIHPGLGIWVTNHRQYFKNNVLSIEKAKLLESLDGWTWDAKADEWMQRFNELKKYSHIHGHARPPSNEPSIGQWVVTVRSRYKKGSLSQYKIENLESLDGWTWDANEFAWEQKYNELQEFVEQHGHARPKYTEGSLGKWVTKQRYKESVGDLSEDKVRRLESLSGWQWSL